MQNKSKGSGLIELCFGTWQGKKRRRESFSISAPGPRPPEMGEKWDKTLTPNPRGRGESECQLPKLNDAAVRVRDGLAGVARRGEVLLRGGLACRGIFLTCERSSPRVCSPGAKWGGGIRVPSLH